MPFRARNSEQDFIPYDIEDNASKWESTYSTQNRSPISKHTFSRISTARAIASARNVQVALRRMMRTADGSLFVSADSP